MPDVISGTSSKPSSLYCFTDSISTCSREAYKLLILCLWRSYIPFLIYTSSAAWDKREVFE
ncbi:hypothetical protein D3C75_1208010 [compost metagenome]